MAVNRGKDFEAVIKEAFEKVPNTSVYRIPDQQNYKVGSKNPCDFFVYHKPILYALECKATNRPSLPLTNILEYQWKELLKMSKVEGVVAGVLCWYVKNDITIFIPIKRLQICKEEGWKSINYAKALSIEDVVEIKGRKKRVFWEYDMEMFFQSIPQ